MRHGLLILMLGSAVALSNAQAPADKAKKAPSGKTSDVELVERLLAARKEYQLTLEELRKYYIKTGDITRARWSEEELLQYHRMLKQVFRMELELPPPTLKGDMNIPEAN